MFIRYWSALWGKPFARRERIDPLDSSWFIQMDTLNAVQDRE